MALQRLYSRVPAKVSMFNRTDSFDTFARSERLEREFIERELAAYSDIRLTAREAADLRDKGLQPLYFQYKAKSGEVVQNCVSYIPLDYTGERSSYLIHSLVLEESDFADAFENSFNNSFEPDMFEKDLDKYNITHPDSAPNNRFPEVKYSARGTGDLSWLKKYDQNTFMRYIYSVLAGITGKTKGSFIYLGVSSDECSETSLKFFNSFMQILPYHLRPYFSFLSRISDASRFSGIKFKSVTDDCTSIPTNKWATVNFRNKATTGILDSDVSNNLVVVDFLYSLLDNDLTRTEFLRFADYAVKEMPALGAPTLKAITDLVILFKASCGIYDENKVLPTDEKVLDFFTIYDKSRSAMSDEYRINAMRCLRRYPAGYREIPRKIFAKITKFYPSEPACVKLVIMDIALELIHTDVMRDRLFTFIKNNYDKEPDTVRDKINQDLVRVYYGGFLMDPILDFFADHFKDEPAETKKSIIEKLVLSIRTKEIQDKLFKFIDDNYDYIDLEGKAKIYTSALENLPDADELSEKLVRFINSHIELEEESIRDGVQSFLIKLMESEERKKSHPFIDIVSKCGGWASIVLAGKLFSGDVNEKVYSSYIKGLCKGSITERVNNIIEAYKVFPENIKEDNEKLIADFSENFMAEPCELEIYELLDAQEKFYAEFKAMGNSKADEFCERFAADAFPKLIGDACLQIFKKNGIPDSAERIKEYTTKHFITSENKNYDYIESYLNLKDALKLDNASRAINACYELRAKKGLGSAVAEYLDTDLNLSTILYMIAWRCLKKGAPDINSVYIKLMEGKGGDGSEALAIGNAKELSKICNEIMCSNPSEAAAENFAADKSGIIAVLSVVSNSYGKKAKQELSNYLNKELNSEYSKTCLALMNGTSTAKGGLFSKIFIKK